MRNIKHSKYKIDEEGNVFSRSGRKLKLQTSKKGYLSVKVIISGKTYRRPVHRLVADAFLPNPFDKPMVNHLDGVKTNNHISNLEWCTAKENSRHAVDVLGMGIGATHSQVKVSEEDIHTMCRRLEDGERNIDIARDMGLPREMISRLRRGVCWGHISKDYTISRSRRPNIGDTTFLWVCHRLQEGMSSREIIQICNNHSLTKGLISRIKTGKLRPHLSENFSF